MKHLHLSKRFNFYVYHVRGKGKLGRYLDSWALRNLDNFACLRYIDMRGFF